MGKSNKHKVYGFGDFRLDAGTFMLYCGPEEVSLPPKVVKTLVVLVENRGQIVPKDELIDKVWEDSIVEESNLSQYLYLLRKTLGQMPDGGPYIETLRRRGYRFNGKVRELEDEPAKPISEERARSSFHGSGVERQGNVLRLVDWAVEPQPVVEPQREPAAMGSDKRDVPVKPYRTLAAFAVTAMVVSLALLYIWFRPSERAVEAKSEMSVTRLTNGAFPFSAAVSRDGKYFVYTEIEGDRSQIWLQSVGEASRIKIAESLDKAFGTKAFSPDGRFIYYRATPKANSDDSAVYRMAMMGGPAIKIIDGIESQFSFSPDGGEIAFFRRDSTTGTSSLVISDKDGHSERTVLERKDPFVLSNGPAWSPDGQTVLFSEFGPIGSDRSSLNRIMAVQVASGSVASASAEIWDTLYTPQWMRDGKGFVIIGSRENESSTTRRDQVYYISFPEGASRRITTDAMRHEPSSLSVTDDGSIVTIMSNRSSQIWSMDANGNAATAEQISRGTNDGRAGLAPMPDGKLGYITYASDDTGVWSMNSDGSDAVQLTGSPMTVEELRPDPLGRYFIFSLAKNRQSHLYRINTDGSGLSQVTFGSGREIDSSVSPDGSWIAYGSTEENDKVGSTRLFRSPIDGGEPSLLGDNNCSRPAYSPDGKYLVCITDDDKQLVLVSAVDGSGVRSFQTPPYATINSGVRWLPDSTGFVYIRSDKESSNLWVQPIDGETPRQLTNFTSGVIFNFAFSADGSRIYLARGYPIQDVILIRDFL